MRLEPFDRLEAAIAHRTSFGVVIEVPAGGGRFLGILGSLGVSGSQIVVVSICCWPLVTVGG